MESLLEMEVTISLYFRGKSRILLVYSMVK